MDFDMDSQGVDDQNANAIESHAISGTADNHVQVTNQVTSATTDGDATSRLNATNGHGHTINGYPPPSPAPQAADNQLPGSSLRQKGSYSDGISSAFQASASPSATAESTKLEKEMAQLKDVLAQISPEAAQRVLRQQWRVFLFEPYNEDHISFILRAGLKNSSVRIIDRVFKDRATVKGSVIDILSKKQSIISKVFQNAGYDEVLDLLSQPVLDRALSERLKDVPAKELIRWLAEADRLGYSLDDILDEEDESVLPNVPSRPQTEDEDAEMSGGIKSQPLLALPHSDAVLVEQERNSAADASAYNSVQKMVESHKINPYTGSAMICPICHQQFSKFSGYEYVSISLPNTLERLLTIVFLACCEKGMYEVTSGRRLEVVL